MSVSENKNISTAAFQNISTLAILCLVESNLTRLVLLLGVWLISFWPITRREVISFFILNIVFVIGDICAIKSGFFTFSNPDLLELPYWEFIMWGFYMLHMNRLFSRPSVKAFDWRAIVFAIIFSQLFGLVTDHTLLLISSSIILLATLSLFHAKDDLRYGIYLGLLGILYEYFGLQFNLWLYPGRNFLTALPQIFVLWSTSAILFRRILAGWINTSNRVSQPVST